MSEVEKEVKLRINSIRVFAWKLRNSGYKLLKRRFFEDNFLFDFESKPLLKKGCILRLRIIKGTGVLTFKEPSPLPSFAKVRKETETIVENPSTLFKILKKMGLIVIFRYQKFRRIYRKGNLILSLDETPIGNFIELEGSEEEIIREAKKLGFSTNKFIKKSYMELFHKKMKGNMVFKKSRSVDDM